MIKIYYPYELNKEVNNIKKLFSSPSDKKQVAKKRLEYLIRRIVECSDYSELKLVAYTISKAEFKALVIYMKTNYLNIDLNKIVDVFIVANDFYCFKAFFELWQQDYKNTFEKNIIARLVSHYKVYIAEHYKLKHINILNVWMSSSNAEIMVCKYIANGCANIESFKRRLEELQIKKEYSLYKDIEGIILCYCEEKLYLSLGDKKLLSQIRLMSLEQQRTILYNFLDVVDTIHFEKFETISEYSYDILFGDKTDVLYKKTIGLQSEEIQRAYNAFINLRWLTRLFGKDRRSKFWKKYINDFDVKFFPAHNMLLMKFNRCSIIEFKQMGPVYFFESDYFDNVYVKKRMAQKTADLKSDMYYDVQSKYRKVHQGYWEYDLINQLSKLAL